MTELQGERKAVYRSAKRLVAVFTASTAVLVVSIVLKVPADFIGASRFPATWGDLDADIESTLEFVLFSIVGFTELLYLAAYLTCAISFSMWAYRSNKNARALGVTHLRFSAGWTVGWFFVPIMNLFRPYQAIRELDRVSKPASLAGDSPTATFGEKHLLAFWWGMWLVANALGRFTSLSSRNRVWEELYGPRFEPGLQAVAFGSVAVAAVLATLVMRRIYARQQMRSLQMAFE